MKEILLTCEQDGIRLDKFLSDHFEDLSRTKIQDLIINHSVFVNNQHCKSSYLICVGDQITLHLPQSNPVSDSILPENIELDILHEDEFMIVLNKPAGMVVHPGKGNRTKTLANALVYHFNNLSDLNGPARPGIVHRLDQNTSGVMVVAKTNSAHQYLAEQFQQRQVQKTYIALTWGEWHPESGTIDAPIGRKKKDPTSYTIRNHGRPSITDYKVIDSNSLLSQVHFYPKTGRTHQIRVHSTYMNHPIFGDEKYGGGKNKLKGYMPEVSKFLKKMLNSIQRQALHSYKLNIRHPDTKQKMTFKANLPKDMSHIVRCMEKFYV